MRNGPWLCCLLLALTIGCSDGEGPSSSTDASTTGDAGFADAGTDAGAVDTGTIPPPVWWTVPDQLTLDDPLYAAHPKVFSRMSRWVTHVAGDPRPDVGHRGSFGTGNGRVFGFVGLDYPLNTLHSLVGPTYEKKKERFFGDYQIFLNDAGSAAMQPFDEEWAARSLSAPVLVTRGRSGAVELDTTDFAPVAPGDAALEGCFLRILTARNRGAAPSPALEIVVDPHNGVRSPEPGALLEGAESRGLTTRFDAAGAIFRNDHLLILPIGALAAAEEKRFVLSHCTREDLTPAAAPTVDPDALLDAAADAYAAWEAGLVAFRVPDPMVADFLDGMKMTLKVQTAATGASCPMSEYTRTWTRDNIGPVMAWLDLGAHEDTVAIVDYLYGAILEAGDLQNSYPADLDLSSLAAAPDWDAMPVMTGRIASESPSYNVITYGLFRRHTGDTGRADERFGLLRRCLMKQNFGEDRLLPFSGDETYRAAMNASFGLALEYPHHDKSFSSNSALLWLAAAKEYAALARATGRESDAAAAEAIAVEVEAGFRKRYLLAYGCVSAFVNRDTGEAWSAPYEDEAMQVTWSGWKDGDDDLARSTFDCLHATISREPGVMMSRLDPKYRDWFNAKKGVYTGMLPGFTLATFTELGHPEAQDAFNMAARSMDTTGNLAEYLIYDDFSGLSLIYDPVGGQGDYTAKFRPWEGGIVFDAIFKYLTGFSPDAPAKTISLRPHLPNGWPAAAYNNLRVADDRFDLTVTRTGPGAFDVTLASRAAADYTVTLRWDAPAGTEPAFSVDGAPIADTDVTRREHYGQVSGMITTALPAGTTVVVGIR